MPIRLKPLVGDTEPPPVTEMSLFVAPSVLRLTIVLFRVTGGAPSATTPPAKPAALELFRATVALTTVSDFHR